MGVDFLYGFSAAPLEVVVKNIKEIFLSSVFVLKNRPKMLNACLAEAERWKKTGDLTAEQFDEIMKMANRLRLG
jgi:hypothetical protein